MTTQVTKVQDPHSIAVQIKHFQSSCYGPNFLPFSGHSGQNVLSLLIRHTIVYYNTPCIGGWVVAGKSEKQTAAGGFRFEVHCKVFLSVFCGFELQGLLRR